MQLGEQLLFFLAGLGVFNGFLLAIYCSIVIRPRRWVNFLFAFLLLALCIRVGKSIIHSFYDLDRIWRQIGLSTCMLIGPLLFTYIRSLKNNQPAPRKSDLANLMLPLFGILTIGFLWPYELYPDEWNSWIVQSIYVVWSGYTLMTISLIWPLIKKVIRREDIGTLSTWMLLLVSTLSLLCLAYNLALYGFPYLVGPLLFSLIFYLLIGFLINKARGKVIFYEAPQKYSQPIDDAKATDLADRLATVMNQQQLFLHPKVKLAEIAEVVQSNPHELSRIINERMGISFNQYINQLRVDAACELLLEADHLTIEGIGQEVGFTSRSAFYQSFKAFKHETPARYKTRVSSE